MRKNELGFRLSAQNRLPTASRRFSKLGSDSGRLHGGIPCADASRKLALSNGVQVYLAIARGETRVLLVNDDEVLSVEMLAGVPTVGHQPE